MANDQIFDVVTVVDDELLILEPVSGQGFPRLFQGEGALYVYNLNGSLFASEDLGFTWDNIIPEAAAMIQCIAQSFGTANWGGEVLETQSAVTTIVFFTILGSSSGSTMYQKIPEVYNGWRHGGDLEASLVPSDAIGDTLALLSIIVGNLDHDEASRALRSAASIPYSTWAQSDSGLPALFSVIDLEAAG